MITTLVAVLAVLVGSCLQASVGVGLGILAAPILALLWPGAVPGPMLVCAFVLSILVVTRDRRDLDYVGPAVALIGRLPGIAVAILLLNALAGTAWIDVAMGALLTACVLLSMAKGHVVVEPKNGTVLFAGFLSGVSGTATGVGGPPIALVWSRLPPARLRSTLGGYFLVGTGVSAILLWVFGGFGDARALYWLLPATVMGFAAASKLRDRIDSEWTYRTVLGLAALASLVLLARGILAVL